MSLLKIKDLTKTFGGLVAVNNVNFSVEEGEILGLIGPNGAGKTTLFNVISGNYQPDSGQVEFDGQNISGLKPHQVTQRGITRTFQIVKPFAGLSVVDNVMVGAFLNVPHASDAENLAREVIDFVGLNPFADQPAQNLTTAGRKRLELARALATQAKLLLLDEVMAGLTPTESINIVKLIQQIRERGITLLVIEHVMQAIMTLSDRIAVIHHGELIAVGEPKSIAKDSKVIEAYLGKEFSLA
jgi:branched-chain amino acid transport system ATP-binding protein